MRDRDVDLLPYVGWEGEVSSQVTIKQKLSDFRIEFESASIQGKRDKVAEIELLCEKISYRAGGDAKFDIMMSVIRVYRHLLNEQDKAEELEQKMRKGMPFILKENFFKN